MTIRPNLRAAVAKLTAVVLTLAAGTACSTAGNPPPLPGTATGTYQYPYTPEDVEFMQGMIPHHAQAVRMARLAPTRAANESVQILAERILVGQRDEIRMMQYWLSDRGQTVPDSNATHMRMTMGGMEHDMLMPGMLTEEEMARLAAARGAEFDRLFLTYMIRHHAGAVSMVDKLFASGAAAQDETVFRLASDIYADQTTEIDRMQKILETLPPAPLP